ncbi:neutral/alkaline non-lysosomal ceramidase N-terminal domain-containing protein [Blastopirellula sp. JC732]|uniref:Neutral ceramidase n=1 Tax=Blastopirellula sediminis TaxID=2894196 RepID=A0A9X1SGU3_9BACT|nr:neutral/alkaline non-lysosomal ceramidase N-terminal domain-containing protein [Blastopirellula sediminis]MCC9606166.1 neutral/alkaline non-lysosomal ceramidase N-terminal domain-containing protein [Blastopirellula sediminis]MCC9630535.1 neutral/alkaline non-lysosomal ceramidase N-terminal domain-containing protein [Blastopirellula sediminis]
MNLPIDRRSFLKTSLRSSAALGLAANAVPLFASPTSPNLQAGQGVVDTTVPNGVELGGFHRPPGNPRVATDVRQATASRAIALRCGDVEVALVSLDVLAVSADFTQKVQARVHSELGIPPQNVHITATHTHSTPSFIHLRQWGKIPEDYLAKTIDAVVQSIKLAHADLTPAELYLGKSQAKGANFNRTTPNHRTDLEFDQNATDEERWVDTLLQTLRFQRTGGKPDILWYHFSSHPVCYTDTLSGPDWVGMVVNMVKESEGVEPGFWQGHAGDVNPGDGKRWIGAPDQSANAVYAAIKAALSSAVSVPVREIHAIGGEVIMPFDHERVARDVETYRTDPDACRSGIWVDPPFAADWYAAAKDWPAEPKGLTAPMSAIALGPIGMLFQPTELYSYYGIEIRKQSPFEHTLVVGYSDDEVGYVTDPNAYKQLDYAAIVGPKILNRPYFAPNTGRDLTKAAKAMLASLA